MKVLLYVSIFCVSVSLSHAATTGVAQDTTQAPPDTTQAPPDTTQAPLSTTQAPLSTTQQLTTPAPAPSSTKGPGTDY